MRIFMQFLFPELGSIEDLGHCFPKQRAIMSYNFRVLVENEIADNRTQNYNINLKACMHSFSSLKVETGRYTKPVTPVDLRLCELCNLNVTEDEKHFLLSCPFYDDIRYELFNGVTMYNQSFYDLSTDEKFTYILGNDNIQKFLAKTVKKKV